MYVISVRTQLTGKMLESSKKDVNDISFERVHRIGKSSLSHQKPRTIIAKLTFHRASVMVTLQLIHLIVCDQQNLCAMVKTGALEKQKLGQLQHFCSELGLAVPDLPMKKKKALYVTLLKELIQGCTCME